jgi:sugar phosphate isomerase/epimerase
MIYFKAIVLDQTLSLFDWLEIASGLPRDGTEIHWRMLPNASGDIDRLRGVLHVRHLRVSQVTCAPDFTNPDATVRTADRTILDQAARHQVLLAFENHYKDYFWEHPDFAQRAETFLAIVHALGPHGLRVN